MPPSATSSWTAQATVTASLTAFLFQGFVYNAVFLGRILPSFGKEEQVTPLLVVFNVVWGLALWSYLRVSWSDPGAIPEEWHEFVRRVGIALPIAPGMKEWQPGKATMCKHCTRARPERAHHCALCGVCILRLDHHCPWINNCVGFNNHKYFLLTCSYALLACAVGFFTAAPELVMITQRLRLAVHGDIADSELEPSDEIAFVVFGALAVFIAMFLSPLLYFQVKLAVSNKTVIEDNYSNMTNPFDQGAAFSNLEQIFGKLGPDWLLPIKPWRPLLDGASFPSSWERHSFDERPLFAGNGAVSELEDYSSRENEDGVAGRQNAFLGDRSKNWARAHGDGPSKLSGEALWRLHYHIIEKAYNPADFKKPSTIDYMLGCMQIDCEGNQRAVFA